MNLVSTDLTKRFFYSDLTQNKTGQCVWERIVQGSVFKSTVLTHRVSEITVSVLIHGQQAMNIIVQLDGYIGWLQLSLLLIGSQESLWIPTSSLFTERCSTNRQETVFNQGGFGCWGTEIWVSTATTTPGWLFTFTDFAK